MSTFDFGATRPKNIDQNVQGSAGGAKIRSNMDSLLGAELVEISLTGPIDEIAADIVCDGFFKATRRKQASVMFFIHSTGGSVAAGKRILDAMRVYRKVVHGGVHTHVAVQAMSMAAVLFLYGDYRTMCKTATLMLHQVSIRDTVTCSRTATDSASSSAYHTKLNSELFEIVASRCLLTMEDLRRQAFAQDWYVCAEDAVKSKMVECVLDCSPYTTIQLSCKLDIHE
ncbi:hypothetical protein CYMTET_41021 [Cymbomonas tetramitiformis]|uniref:ATP-dependent Clp protease proteolytic subunit n=1 Tax=Cymbomonas tetramitiformis TaxID=36881 RepID=A0AAE0F2Y5_9CHLO|nr:hypothetical protein CYMTET_47284 [Cymbomonas tetramitiformis]KAK3249549.1 hypothetical protein CYMTET_41028 [Cymbomonas tetramitiformis]KAK3249575.1 hypothetical protein CYMTET_41021 [Cymbomonas tetramitiformis]